MAAAVPVALLSVHAEPEQPAAPRFIRICLRHQLPLEEVLASKSPASRFLTETLRCPGPAVRPRTWPGQPPGTHRPTSWGVFDRVKGRVVAIGSEARIILLDDFDYPADKGIVELLGAGEVDTEIGPDAPHVAAALAANRKVARGTKLTREMVAALKVELSTPGWRIKDILTRYDICQAALYQIRKGQLWQSVPGPEPVPPAGSPLGPRPVKTPRTLRVERHRKAATPGTRTWNRLTAQELEAVRVLSASKDSGEVALLFGISATDVLKIKHGMVGC